MLAWCLIMTQVVWYDMSLFGHSLVLHQQQHVRSVLKCKCISFMTKHIADLQATMSRALAKTVLSDQQKAWMRSSVLSAYECCRTCYERLQDLQALHQVWQTILLLHESTSPASGLPCRRGSHCCVLACWHM